MVGRLAYERMAERAGRSSTAATSDLELPGPGAEALQAFRLTPRPRYDRRRGRDHAKENSGGRGGARAHARRRRGRGPHHPLGRDGRCADARSARDERRRHAGAQPPDLRHARDARPEGRARRRARGVVADARLRRAELGVPAPAGRAIPQRRRAHRRRRRVLAAAGAGAGLGPEGAPRLGRPRHQGRRPDVPRQDQGPEPAVPERPHRRVHPEPRLGRGERRGAAAGLASRARRLHGAQRQRHRPLRARVARARRPHRAEAQRAILEQGPRRAARDHRSRPYADPLGRGADRGARRRRARLRPGRPGAGRRPPEEPAQRHRHHRQRRTARCSSGSTRSRPG